jgi:hypothetical protein
MTDWVGTVCRAALKRLGVDGAAVSVRAGDTAQDLVAATGRWARCLEELQYTMGEGPGVAAYTEGEAVLVADLETGLSRWPGFTDGAAAVGVGAAFAFPVSRGPEVLGTLDLYRHRAGPLSTDHLKLAALLADVAAMTLYTTPETSGEGYYADVSMATGMVAVQLKLTTELAFLRLRARAFTESRSLLDVAREVIAGRLRFDE